LVCICLRVGKVPKLYQRPVVYALSGSHSIG
jgi:hypothetical protein